MNNETQEPINKPWLFQKGNRMNPGGRPKGSKSLKTRAREYLEGLSDEEAFEYFEGLNKLDVWQMGEGKPDTKSEVKVSDESSFTEQDVKTIKELLGLGDKATDSPSA